MIFTKNRKRGKAIDFFSISSVTKYVSPLEDFLEETKMSPTAFGVKAKAEPNFVFTLRAGRECREDVQERVTEFMDNYKKDQNDGS